jgi:surface protein
MTFVFVIDYQIKRMEQINTNALCEQLRKSHPCNTNIGSMLGKHNLTNENYFESPINKKCITIHRLLFIKLITLYVFYSVTNTNHIITMDFDNETIRIAVQLYLENEKEGEEKYGHINTWNVSNVTDMSYMFSGAHSFNQPLSNWNVSNVTNMTSMFCDARSFNRPLNNWDVSNVTNMKCIFCNAISFNRSLNNWDVSNVTNMARVFNHAKSFNRPLNNWDVSNVENMYGMFCNASSFNQPLNNWNVSNITNVTNMYSMFEKTIIGNMLKKHNLTNENYFDKNVYHELFVWPRKKDYIMFLVNNHYLPFNKHQEEHEYHPLFDNPDISKYIAYYL